MTTTRATAEADRLLESELTDDPGFLLVRARNICQGAVATKLESLDLRVRQYSVLTLACSGQAPTQRELAGFLQLDPGQIVALIDPLEERGLVRRVVDENDRRNKLIVATAAGRALQRKARVLCDEANAETMAELSLAERDILQDLLFRIAF